MATAKKTTKKGGEIDPICEYIARDKKRPLSGYEMRQLAEKSKASKTPAKKTVKK